MIHPIFAILFWFLLWSLIPWVTGWSIGTWLFNNTISATLVDVAVAVGVLAVLFLTHRRFNKALFRRQWTVWLYVIPTIALLAIPLRVGGLDGDIFGNPAWLYMLTMLVSVVAQQYLTFGLLQSYLSEKLSTPLAILATTLVFYLGHAILIADKFAPIHLANALFIVLLGVIFASIRAKASTLHANLALHLVFYFILIG